MSEYNNRDKWDKRSLSMMLDEHLKEFNKKAQKLIEDEIYSNLNKDYFPTGEVPLVADSVLLYSMLYSNAKGVNKKVATILNENFKAKRTIKDTAMRIYDGYNSNVDNLDVKKGLPKYLLEDRDAMRQIDKLTNKRLKETYKKVYENLKGLDEKALKKAMWVALQEKSRYYANRIAQTEGARSRNLNRAVEYMEDDEIEYVKFEMSSAHKIVDICNYYASLDVGYGAGIVKKESMRVLPLHPHCHCRYTPYYKKIQKTNIKNPQKNTMNKFSKFEKRAIVGSFAKLLEFEQGAEIEGLFNRVRPKYPIQKYSDVLGYNGGMKTFKSNYLKYSKSGYFDMTGIVSDNLMSILDKTDIKKIDIDEIKKVTQYKIEGAIVYNNQKRELFIGSSVDRVEIPINIIENADIIHSHPIGVSFTVEDILEVITENANSIVAFNDEYLYKFINNIEIEYNDFKDIIISEISNLDYLLENKIKNGTISTSQKDFSINHKVWLNISQKVKGFNYEAYKIIKK